LSRALQAVTGLAIVSISFGLGLPRASAASLHNAAGAAPAENPRNLPEAKLLSVPLSFEPNQGQVDSKVQFVSRGSGYAVLLAPGSVVLNLQGKQAASLRMSLIGANRQPKAVGLDHQSGVVSYFIGNDPKKWRSGIPTYGKVEYRQVYPGVDLVFYGNQRQLEYDFVVAPGADPARIAWRIDGARASVDTDGNLALTASDGPASFKKPVVHQIDGDKRASVDGAFVVAGNEVRFRLGGYDRSKALIIDPVLSYATYLAGTSTDYIGNSTGPGILQNDQSQGLAVDNAGSVYVTGHTSSLDFPVANGLQNKFPSSNTNSPSTFVTKFSPDGSSLVYSTYIGGSDGDQAYAIAVDAAGEAFITGSASSPDFPITTGAYQTICTPIPTDPPNQIKSGCPGGGTSAFVTKLNSKGTGLVYSTFLGGYGNAYATAIAVDAAGRAYIAGDESESCHNSYAFPGCFPTTGGAVIGGNAPTADAAQYAFVAAFDPTGAQLLYSSLFGDTNVTCPTGCGLTQSTGIAVDSTGAFYLIGYTKAGKLPTTPGVIQPAGAPLDANGVYVLAFRGYIAKFNPVTSAGGVSLAYATYLGGKTGNTSDYLSGIAIDGAGNAYVAGYTNSADFPVTPGAYGTACGGAGVTCAAAHVTKLNPSASAMVWSTYVGGSMQDGGDDLFFTGPVQLDGKGNVYIVGSANPAFPLINPVEPPVSLTAGSGDVVVAELDPTGSHLLFSSQVGSGGRDSAGPGGLAVDAAGNIFVAGNILGPDLITTPGAFQTTNPSPVCCNHGYVAKIVPSVGPLITVVGYAPAVFNGATFQTGSGIAPNEFISLFGAGLGPQTGVSSAMTTELAGTSVSIGGTAAYLIYAQDGQINALVPFNVSGLQSTTIQVQYNGVAGNSVTVPVVASSPGIFTQAYGPGQAWMANQDGTFNSSTNPAPRSTYVAFWVTGQGVVNTTLGDGVQPSGPPYPAPLFPVSVSLGGAAVPAANIAFVGLIYSGEIQVNVLIPDNAPTGSAVPLVVTIGGASSRVDATVAIQ
jgi:uncharacterized protein (TIGR03437 family)